MTEWTDHTIERLRTLWGEGHSTAEIGRRLGHSKNAIIGKARRHGLPGRSSPSGEQRALKWTAAIVARAMRMQAEGQTPSQIAAVLSASDGNAFPVSAGAVRAKFNDLRRTSLGTRLPDLSEAAAPGVDQAAAQPEVSPTLVIQAAPAPSPSPPGVIGVQTTIVVEPAPAPETPDRSAALRLGQTRPAATFIFTASIEGEKMDASPPIRRSRPEPCCFVVREGGRGRMPLYCDVMTADGPYCADHAIGKRIARRSRDAAESYEA
jgi:GcrA cell cycle regulator